METSVAKLSPVSIFSIELVSLSIIKSSSISLLFFALLKQENNKVYKLFPERTYCQIALPATIELMPEIMNVENQEKSDSMSR